MRRSFVPFYSKQHHIPTGRHRLHEEAVPAEILDVMNRDPTSPELPRLNKAIQNRICVHKRKKWRDFVETMDQKTDVTKLWRTIKEIDGREKHEAENEAITFNGISFSSSKQLATKFNQQFVYFKAGQTYFFKRDQVSDEGNQEETIGGANIHHRPSYESNQELQK